MPELDQREWGDDEPALEELYDDMTLRRLGLDPADRRRPPVGPTGPADPAIAADAVDAVDEEDGFPTGVEPGSGPGSGLGSDPERVHPVRRRVAGAMLAGAMLGLGDVLEPEKTKDAVVEPELLGEPPIDQPVQFIMVPGLPKASVVILRPWLRRRPNEVRGPRGGTPHDAQITS